MAAGEMAGLVIGVAGIVVGVVAYYKGQKQPRLRYAIRSNAVVRDLGDDFFLAYRGQRISRATSVMVVFRNDGSGVLRSSDVASKDPVRVVVGAEVLATYVAASKTASDVGISRSDNEVVLSFDYIDPDERVWLGVLHTGQVRAPVQVRGSLKGIGTPELLDLEGEWQRRFRGRLIGLFTSIVSLAVVLAQAAGDDSMDLFQPVPWWVYVVVAVPAVLLVRETWVMRRWKRDRRHLFSEFYELSHPDPPGTLGK